jgi:hypothetical protein
VREPGDELEASVGSYIVDILRGTHVVEVQTGNLSAIRDKIGALLESYTVEVVLPLSSRTTILLVGDDDAEVSRRQSPRHAGFADAFTHLVYITSLISHPGLTIRVLLVRELQVRRADGRGSRRRRGVSIVSRALESVEAERTVRTPDDLWCLLGEVSLPDEFTTSDIASVARIRRKPAQAAAYTLRQTGRIESMGRGADGVRYRRVSGADERPTVSLRPSPS